MMRVVRTSRVTLCVLVDCHPRLTAWLAMTGLGILRIRSMTKNNARNYGGAVRKGDKSGIVPCGNDKKGA